MIDEEPLEFVMVNPEDDSTFNNMTTSSAHIFSTEFIDTSIEDARNTKKTLASKMDSVISLIRKVECEEKAAEQAKEEADKSIFDILVKVDECKQALKQAEETNDMLVRKVYVQKAILATKMMELQFRMAPMLDDEDRSLEVLDEMSSSLEMRLSSALMKKELAMKKKQDNEAFSQVELAYEAFVMEKVLEETRKWKQETLEINELLKFLKNRGLLVNKLHGEITDECQDVKQLKEDLDQIPLGELLSFNQKLSMLAASSSSLRSSKLERIKNVAFETNVKDTHVVENITEGQVMSSDGLVALQSTFRCNDFGENPRDVETRELNKLGGNQMLAKSIKKMRTNNRKFAKRIKKVKMKGLKVVSTRNVAVNHKEDSLDIELTFGILFIMIIVQVFLS